VAVECDAAGGVWMSCVCMQCHPDRLKAKGGDEGSDAHTELYRELMAEETFKLVTYHRDILKAQMGGA
jgi:hypothetical protein